MQDMIYEYSPLQLSTLATPLIIMNKTEDTRRKLGLSKETTKIIGTSQYRIFGAQV